jgi:ABC-type nitrate/sulfonate/bicarbonate transport system permease component
MNKVASEIRRVPVLPGIGRYFGPKSKAAAAIAVWLLLWWAVVRLFDVSPDFLPSPEAVIRKIWQLNFQTVGEGTLWLHIATSLWRFSLGFLVAMTVGVTLGFLMAYFRPVDYIVTPLFELMRYVPPIAWAPFAILWFGASLGSQTFVIFVSAFPPILMNAYKGIKMVDPSLINAARSLGASPRTILLEVGLPSSIPVLITGLRIGLANAWMALVAAEIVAGAGVHNGLGFLILVGQQTLQANVSIAAMVLIGLVGAAVDFVIRYVERRFLVWR